MANTVSTGSAASKKASKKTRARSAVETNDAVETPNPGDVSERFWRIAVVVIFVIAAVLRLYDLNLVPLHHDEGVNGNFLLRLVREGVYTYDPENYHGPTLYYFAAFFPWVMRVLFGKAAQESYGLTTIAIRVVPALFGLATIWLVFLLRRRLGAIATLTAALLLAVSPGAVYLSRYFIHETPFVFFTLGIVVASVYLYDQRNSYQLITAAASASLLFATKETAVISAGVLIIAFAVTRMYLRLHRGKTPRPKPKGRTHSEQATLRRLVAELGGPVVVGWYVGLAAIVFVGLYLLFYSSFFTNSKGISDSFQTFAIWTKTGTVAHVHPIYTYILWLVRQEGPLLFLGALGAVFVVVKPKNSFALFSALWAFGLVAAYSLIPYKTPWLVLNFIVPLSLIAGYALQAVYELDKRHLRLVIVLLVIPIAVSTYQTIDLNFKNYDNDDPYYVYVYAHTTRGILDLVKEIDRIAQQESGGLTGITIVSPDYWPLPWYLRNYSRVGYYGQLAQSTEPIIIANANQKPDMDANYGEVYRQVPSREPDGSFELRPGVRLLLYERRKGFAPAQPSSLRRP